MPIAGDSGRIIVTQNKMTDIKIMMDDAYFAAGPPSAISTAYRVAA